MKKKHILYWITLGIIFLASSFWILQPEKQAFDTPPKSVASEAVSNVQTKSSPKMIIPTETPTPKKENPVKPTELPIPTEPPVVTPTPLPTATVIPRTTPSPTPTITPAPDREINITPTKAPSPTQSPIASSTPVPTATVAPVCTPSATVTHPPTATVYPISSPSPTPVPTAKTVPTTSCNITVSCKNALQSEALSLEKRKLLPKNGIILSISNVDFSEGDSAFQILSRELRKQKIHFEYSENPMFQSAYIEGINNLYEFDCGAQSGWLYIVNGKSPGVGCSQYVIQPGDSIEFIYSCNFGKDIF